MGILTLIIYFIASIGLGIILNWVDINKKENLIDYVAITNIYMIILSGIFDVYNLTKNNDNIFGIVVFLILGKIFYLTLIKERTILRNNDYDLKKYLITLMSSYLVNILIINRVDNIFPGEETIKLLVWLFIIGYVYIYIKNNASIKISTCNNVEFYQDREYIVMQYAKYKSKYSNLISSKCNYLNQVIYSMMIYENYNKPELIRKVDIFKYKMFHKVNKFGIMQVDSNQIISDEESIGLVIKKLEKIYGTNIKDNNLELDIVKILIKKYYKRKVAEVESIYQIINEFNKE